MGSQLNLTPLLFPSLLLFLIFFIRPAHAFGAGNIPSIAKIEGGNFRHGDIEDTLLALTFLGGKKWTAANVKRVYFGNWLRDYSQALDVGTLKGVPAGTIRVLVWVLAFMGFGYATAEFEVTAERLGVYRPEEHIDNPKDYADNLDARVYDARLRPPVHPAELAIDPATGMKNYIANEAGGWATSSGYVKHSLNRSIYYGRKYTSEGLEADLHEALRCLGQALHTLEDFSAHSNYVELVLHELGFNSVFPHVGTQTQINVHGKWVWPLITGTFGGVDFLHSVLGEAQDKFTQTEIDEVTNTFEVAHDADKNGDQCSMLRGLLDQLPGAGGLGAEADALEKKAQDKERQQQLHPDNYGSRAATSSGSFDAEKLARDIYPILEFRDKVVRAISDIVNSIPGLASLVETISEQLTIFVFSILAPYILPLISQASNELKNGSSTVIDSAKKAQFEPWHNPICTDPTHSMLSKDHFSNVLNQPAGKVSCAVVAYVVPRIVYAWEHTTIPVQQVLDDVVGVFHHPGLRNPNSELHNVMFEAVRSWQTGLKDQGRSLATVLSAEGVKTGQNHSTKIVGGGGCGGHGKIENGGEWKKADKVKKGKKDKKDSGDIKIGGMKIPLGAVGGGAGGAALPGVLGEFMSGFQQASGGGSSGKEHKDKDKKDKSKKEKEGKEYKYDEYGNKIKDKKDKKEKDYHKSGGYDAPSAYGGGSGSGGYPGAYAAAGVHGSHGHSSGGYGEMPMPGGFGGYGAAAPSHDYSRHGGSTHGGSHGGYASGGYASGGYGSGGYGGSGEKEKTKDKDYKDKGKKEKKDKDKKKDKYGSGDEKKKKKKDKSRGYDDEDSGDDYKHSGDERRRGYSPPRYESRHKHSHSKSSRRGDYSD